MEPVPATQNENSENVAVTPAAPKAKKVKKTFMLHKPGTYENLGKFVSTDFRYAALKAASRGHEDILLRITNTKLVYQYKGEVVKLDKPQVVKRGERTITYSMKPTVKFLKKFIYEGEVNDGDEIDGQEQQPKAKRIKKNKKEETVQQESTA